MFRLCVFAAACASQDRRIERLAGERNKAAGTLAALEAERAFLAARGRCIETEAAPTRYVAELSALTPIASGRFGGL
jgi:hypothetical protein